jgi:hypothetical protein
MVSFSSLRHSGAWFRPEFFVLETDVLFRRDVHHV